MQIILYNVCMARPARKLNLSDSGLIRLKEFLDKSKDDSQIYRRARVLELIHEGFSNETICIFVSVCSATIANVRRRYFQGGIEHAITELPRSGAPPRISPQDEDAIILLARTPPPEGHRRWTLRLLAEMAVENGFITRISHNQVGVILRKHNVKLD